MSRGYLLKTPERVAEARRLRDRQGLTLQQIGERLGVKPKSISAWLVDPDGSRARDRREGYRGACERCRAPTDGSDGPGKARRLCNACSLQRQRDEATWTRDRCLAEAKRWRNLAGRWPVGNDWNPSACGNPETRRLVERLHDLTGPWPHPFLVGRVFGSWNAFVAAVGGDPNPRYGGNAGVPKGARPTEYRRLIREAEARLGANTDSLRDQLVAQNARMRDLDLQED